MGIKINLRLCPFCDYEAELETYEQYKNAKVTYYVACHGPNCPVLPRTRTFNTIQEAADAWNGVNG